MAYRKIVVHGKTFEYVVGKTHTKVKGIGVVTNDKIGQLMELDPCCECCGTPMSELYPSLELVKALVVKPVHVSRWIQSVC